MLLFCGACGLRCKPLHLHSDEKYTGEKALGMIRASRGALAPVYGPLAAQIVADFNLEEKTGIGIDLGSGPGTLIVELCKRTQLHWINADINPHFFPYFYKEAEKYGFGHRVSAIFADAQELPFRSSYADVIVSRGCFSESFCGCVNIINVPLHQNKSTRFTICVLSRAQLRFGLQDGFFQQLLHFQLMCPVIQVFKVKSLCLDC